MLKTGSVISLAVTFLFIFNLKSPVDDSRTEKQSGPFDSSTIDRQRTQTMVEEDNYPAGSVPVELYEPDKVARTQYEKQGVQRLRSGKPCYEEVII